MLTPQVILTEVLYNVYNSYVNAEYHYNKYLNEVNGCLVWLWKMGTRILCEYLHTGATDSKCFYCLIKRTWDQSLVLPKIRDTEAAEVNLVCSPVLSGIWLQWQELWIALQNKQHPLQMFSLLSETHVQKQSIHFAHPPSIYIGSSGSYLLNTPAIISSESCMSPESVSES